MRSDAGRTGAADRVRKVVEAAAPNTPLDPTDIAIRTHVPPLSVLGLLRLLEEEHAGRLELRIVDNRGLEVASFRTIPEIPSSVEDEFGDVTEVTPQNVQVVFRKAAT